MKIYVSILSIKDSNYPLIFFSYYQFIHPSIYLCIYLPIYLYSQESNAKSAVRVQKMNARQDLLESLKRGALEKLAAVTKKPEYARLLKDLIVQGLLKLDEPKVQIIARAEDKAIVSRVVSGLATYFVDS